MGTSESTLKDGEAAPVPSEEAHAFLRKAVQDLNTVAIAAAAPSSRAVQANSRLLERLIDKFIGTSLAAVWQRWCRFCEVDAAKLPYEDELFAIQREIRRAHQLVEALQQSQPAPERRPLGFVPKELDHPQSVPSTPLEPPPPPPPPTMAEVALAEAERQAAVERLRLALERLEAERREAQRSEAERREAERREAELLEATAPSVAKDKTQRDADAEAKEVKAEEAEEGARAATGTAEADRQAWVLKAKATKAQWEANTQFPSQALIFRGAVSVSRVSPAAAAAAEAAATAAAEAAAVEAAAAETTLPRHSVPSHSVPSHSLPSHSLPSHSLPSHSAHRTTKLEANNAANASHASPFMQTPGLRGSAPPSAVPSALAVSSAPNGASSSSATDSHTCEVYYSHADRLRDEAAALICWVARGQRARQQLRVARAAADWIRNYWLIYGVMRLAWRRIEAQLAAAELRFKPRLLEQLVLLECRRRRSEFRHMAKPQLLLLERRARLDSFEASAGVVRHTCEADYMRWRALVPQAPLAHRMHRKSMVGAGCHPRLATTLEASPILTIVGYPCQVMTLDDP